MTAKLAWQKRECAAGGHRAISDRNCIECRAEYNRLWDEPEKLRVKSGIEMHPWNVLDDRKGGCTFLSFLMLFIPACLLAMAAFLVRG